MDDAILSLRNICFGYMGGPRVIENLNFDLLPGMKAALTGHNGSGKTTMLHIMMGLLKPESGEVLFHGKVMKSEKDFRLLRQDVGLLFQQADDQLFSPTVLEDVAFGPLNLGKTAVEAVDISRKTLKELGLEGYEDRVPYRLSGGEKKLVSLATVLSMEPRALILDEPTNDLDPDMRKRLSDILKSLDIAMLIVSHDYDFLESVAESEFVCRDGAIFEK
ncbi:energy-coupling factor ABC transporter ATP-binding protein [Maridesulfovibrio bastinii]|uniref:energy-coupling factor ABC transporter ATP-binding protein n=1 Tax=Maridesulfovibrio bastinii TaxID=47157 RepID=UPI0004036B89|nr:ABC transporter ATP-binding protein [Maridesulfovibrio bastinii]